MFRRSCAIAIAILTLGVPAAAQQRGSDVGGQPARRKVTKAPTLTKFVEAEYPANHRNEGAVVVLTIEISATGEVMNVAVEQSAGADFDAAAVAAAKKFVFTPAEVDDKPAPSKITYRYAFVLREPEKQPEKPAPPPATPPPPDVTDVDVHANPRPTEQTAQTTVSAEEARRVPGTQGDVMKVVHNLPGVSRPPINSGQIVVWGAAPRETRTYVDGVDVPALYHGSGLRGTINSDLVASIDLVPGAYDDEYGRGLGGLVRVETRALPRGTHGYVGVDTLDGSGMISTELGSRARIGATFRQGWLDQVLKVTNAPDIGDFFPIPRYRDGQAKLTYDVDARSNVDFVFLGSTDDLTRTVAAVDPASTRSESTHSGFWRAYANYRSSAEGGNATFLTPFAGQDRAELVQRFGGNPARLAIDSNRYGIRSSMRSRIARLPFTVGLDALGTSSHVEREGSLTLPAREGDVNVFGQRPGNEQATDSFDTNIVNIGPHIHADVKLGPLTVTPGARFDMFLIEGSRKVPFDGARPDIGFSRLNTSLQPRVSARVDVSSRLSFHAAYGIYSQAPEPEELSAVFGTPDLTLSKATQVTAGERFAITDSTSLEMTAFGKTMKNLVVRSLLPNPLLARSLTQNGEGQAYGVSFFLRQELWKGFFGWLSYTISRSERRFLGQTDYRLFDYDQPHVLSLVASQEIGRWTFGMRFRYASGNPRTAVIGSKFDARDDRYDPIFGPQNRIRIPAFVQWDVKVERVFLLGERAKLAIYADAQNITNRENAEEIVYSFDYRDRGEIHGLPILAVVGGRLEF